MEHSMEKIKKKKQVRTFIWCSKCKQYKEIRNRRWCNQCYAVITSEYRKKKGVVLYHKCGVCKKEMEPRTHQYCKGCLSEYNKDYNRRKRGIRKLDGNTQLKVDIKGFVDRIVNDNYFIELTDINLIIEYYNMITANISEFDNMPSGSQIFNMFHSIKNWVNEKDLS